MTTPLEDFETIEEMARAIPDKYREIVKYREAIARASRIRAILEMYPRVLEIAKANDRISDEDEELLYS